MSHVTSTILVIRFLGKESFVKRLPTKNTDEKEIEEDEKRKAIATLSVTRKRKKGVNLIIIREFLRFVFLKGKPLDFTCPS